MKNILCYIILIIVSGGGGYRGCVFYLSSFIAISFLFINLTFVRSNELH